MSDISPFRPPTHLPQPPISRAGQHSSLASGLRAYRIGVGLEMLWIAVFTVSLTVAATWPRPPVLWWLGYVLLTTTSLLAFLRAGVVFNSSPVPRAAAILFLLMSILCALVHLPWAKAAMGNVLGMYSARWLVTLCGMGLCLGIQRDRLSIGLAAVALSRIVAGLVISLAAKLFDTLIWHDQTTAFFVTMSVCRLGVSYCEYVVIRRTADSLSAPHPGTDEAAPSDG